MVQSSVQRPVSQVQPSVQQLVEIALMIDQSWQTSAAGRFGQMGGDFPRTLVQRNPASLQGLRTHQTGSSSRDRGRETRPACFRMSRNANGANVVAIP